MADFSAVAKNRKQGNTDETRCYERIRTNTNINDRIRILLFLIDIRPLCNQFAAFFQIVLLRRRYQFVVKIRIISFSSNKSTMLSYSFSSAWTRTFCRRVDVRSIFKKRFNRLKVSLHHRIRQSFSSSTSSLSIRLIPMSEIIAITSSICSDDSFPGGIASFNSSTVI